MVDDSDFLSAFPTAEQPRSSANPDRVRRNLARLEVSTEPCRYGRCPPEHNHPDPFDPAAAAYWPEPEEFRAGWTSQNIPRSTTGHRVPKRCILCWALEAELAAHICVVVEALTA